NEKSQSLLRQRILPDLFSADGELCYILSQSLLRQRILPDAAPSSPFPAMFQGLNRFFVSEYSRTLLCRHGAVDGTRRSQSLLRQRILPDLNMETRGVFLFDRLNRFFVSEYSRTCHLPSGQFYRRLSQSLLRQRILPDRKMDFSFGC